MVVVRHDAVVVEVLVVVRFAVVVQIVEACDLVATEDLDFAIYNFAS